MLLGGKGVRADVFFFFLVMNESVSQPIKFVIGLQAGVTSGRRLPAAGAVGHENHGRDNLALPLRIARLGRVAGRGDVGRGSGPGGLGGALGGKAKEGRHGR